MSENHPAEENPAYDNPNLLLHWEREFIRTSIRFYVDRMRAFLESNPQEGCNIERWEARQEHVMEKLMQFKDHNEPEDDDEEDEKYYEKHLTEITPFKKEDNDE